MFITRFTWDKMLRTLQSTQIPTKHSGSNLRGVWDWLCALQMKLERTSLHCLISGDLHHALSAPDAHKEIAGKHSRDTLSAEGVPR